MAPNTKPEILVALNDILEMELSGVIRYLHYSLMVRGPNRIPIVKWFRDQATEGFDHAAQIGEKVTALGGHPSLKVKDVPETKSHAVMDMLKESLTFERAAVEKYVSMLPLCEGNVALDEMIRDFVRLETEHIEEVEKMLAQDKS